MRSDQLSSSEDRPQPPSRGIQPFAGPEDETIVPTPADASFTLPQERSNTPTLTPTPPSRTLPDQLPASFGRYQLLKLLGQGGMGTVYLAQDSQLDRAVALKVPHFTPSDGPLVLERFYREARAAATLYHANVCPVYDVGAIDGIHYLTMAYLEGRSLAEVLRDNKKPVTPRQAAALVRKLALALEEAHAKNIIHRDLKPGNIMLTKRGEPIIMDFGLARRGNTQDVRLTQQGAIVGTPAYMAPEQAKGNLDEMGPSCDIYSLGVILYELLAGRLPFEGDAFAVLTQLATEEPTPPSRHRPEVDGRIEAICLKALAKKPAHRYRSMTDFAAELTEYLNDTDQTLTTGMKPLSVSAELPFAEPPSASAPPVSRRGMRWPIWAALAGVAVLLSAGGVWWALKIKGKTAAESNDPQARLENKDKEQTDKPKEGDGVSVKPVPSKDTLLPWTDRAIRNGEVLAPDLSKVEPRVHRDFSRSRSQVLENRGFGKGVFYVEMGFWNQWTAKDDTPSVACQVVGRGTGDRGWRLILLGKQTKGGVEVLIGNDGTFKIGPSPWQKHINAHVETPWASHSAIRKDNEYNTLLVILRDRRLEVYINQRAVRNPVPLEQVETPLVLQLGAFGKRKAGRAEFKEFTVWPNIASAGSRSVTSWER